MQFVPKAEATLSAFRKHGECYEVTCDRSDTKSGYTVTAFRGRQIYSALLPEKICGRSEGLMPTISLPLASIKRGAALPRFEQLRSLQTIRAELNRSFRALACLSLAFAVAIIAVENIATKGIVECFGSETSVC
jgi:hypothetical protein